MTYVFGGTLSLPQSVNVNDTVQKSTYVYPVPRWSTERQSCYDGVQSLNYL